MKRPRVAFSSLALLASYLEVHEITAEDRAKECREIWPNAYVRTFKRYVRAGGVIERAYVVVARRKDPLVTG